MEYNQDYLRSYHEVIKSNKNQIRITDTVRRVKEYNFIFNTLT